MRRPKGASRSRLRYRNGLFAKGTVPLTRPDRSRYRYRTVLWWDRVLSFRLPAGEVFGRETARYVASEFGQPPFGGVAAFAVKGAALDLHDEPALLQNQQSAGSAVDLPMWSASAASRTE